MTRRALPGGIPARCLTRGELRSWGLTSRAITEAVRLQRILRPRRGRYLLPETAADVVAAVGLGGAVHCLSLLRLLGVFVFESPDLHIAVPGDSARLPTTGRGVVRHWHDAHLRSVDTVVSPVVALRQALRCQAPRYSLASLDSALHLGVIDERDLVEVFAELPRRFAALRALVDARCESGPETLVRLMLRAIGCSFDVQVTIDGVGRVDFVVNGWLIIECDSEAHHWTERRRDIRRDQRALALGYTPVRVLAEDILYRPDEVTALLRRVVGCGPAAPTRRRRR